MFDINHKVENSLQDYLMRRKLSDPHGDQEGHGTRFHERRRQKKWQRPHMADNSAICYTDCI